MDVCKQVRAFRFRMQESRRDPMVSLNLGREVLQAEKLESQEIPALWDKIGETW